MAAAKTASKREPCEKPCTKVVKFLTDEEIPAGTGISLPPYKSVRGYRHMNVFVRFEQETAGEAPVNLGVTFAFDPHGEMRARRYVNLEENVSSPQGVHFIEVSGAGTWHGSQHQISSYIARFPIMGPYAQVFVYNKEAKPRKVSVWAYLVG